MMGKEWKTLIVAIFIGSVCIGVVSAQGSLVSDYPELKPLVDFVGEEEISVMDLSLIHI